MKTRRTRSSCAGVPGLGRLRGSCLPNTDHQPLSRADPPHRPVARVVAGVADLIGEEPIPELGIVAMRVEQRVRQMRLVHSASVTGAAATGSRADGRS